MSVINFILKLLLIGMIIVFDTEVKKNVMPDGIVKNAKDVAGVYSGG